MQHLVSILLEDVIDYTGAVASPAELVGNFPRVGVIDWGIGGDINGRANIWLVKVVCQQTAIEEKILLLSGFLVVVQLGTDKVLHSKAAKIFNFSRGIFWMRIKTYPIAVFHSNSTSERPLSNLNLCVFFVLERDIQFDLPYHKQIVWVNILRFLQKLSGHGIAPGVRLLLSFGEGT